MSVKVITGNIFTSSCQTIVNTVNCVGVMGAGIALECRFRFPGMHEKYISLCNDNKIEIGLLWVYKSSKKWVLNFPTKIHWKYPSKKEYLHAGLKKFCDTYNDKGIKSIAFPLLGADKGGISQEVSLNIMRSYLDKIDLEIEIYKYDKSAKDDLFDQIKEGLLSKSIEVIAIETNIRKNYVEKLITAIQQPDMFQISQLTNVEGLGLKTLEKVFIYATEILPNSDRTKPIQRSLF